MGKSIFIVLAVILIVVATFSNAIYVYGTGKDATVTIKDTITKIYDGKDTYLVFTTDHGVFKNEDCIWRLKFNSSDIQAALDKGKVYRIEYYGWRIPFLSCYPNIIIVEVK